MSLERRIFYNTLAQTLGKVFATLIGLITIALLSRYLQEKGFGQYSTVIAFLGLFAVVADFGLYLLVTREISKSDTNHREIISNALGMRLTAALASLILGVVLAFSLPYESIVKQTMVVGMGAFLFMSLNQVLVGVFQKHLVQHLVVLSETVGRAVNLVFVYLFIQERLPLPFFLIALLLGNGANFFLSIIFAHRFEKFSMAFDFSVWKKILAASWPLFFAIVLNLLYFKTDTIILSLFHPQEAVGIYSLAYKILEGLLAFPAMFVGLLMPLLSSSAFMDWGKFKQVLQHGFDALLLTGILVVVTIYFFATPIINLLKGRQEYLDSPALLKILILSAATIFLGTLFGYAVVAVNQQKAMIKGYLAGAIVGLLSYFVLIPRFSYWGAAWGTLLSEVTVASFAYFLVRKASNQTISLHILGPALPATLILIFFFGFVSLQWIIEIVFGGMLYLMALIIFQAIPIKLIKEIVFYR